MILRDPLRGPLRGPLRDSFKRGSLKGSFIPTILLPSSSSPILEPVSKRQAPQITLRYRVESLGYFHRLGYIGSCWNLVNLGYKPICRVTLTGVLFRPPLCSETPE